MRAQGDPPADAVARALYAGGQQAAIERLFETLTTNQTPPPRALPQAVRDFLDGGGDLPAWTDHALIADGQRFFMRHAPLITVALNCASLPASYLAHEGVQVIHRTGKLSQHPRRRVVETAQMVFDVMEPGGLDRGGSGVRSVQKVRLLHAAIRQLLTARPESPWDEAALGVPLNQEDLAGVMLTFSVVVTESLARLGVRLTRREREAYLHTWKVVATLLGLRPELLPDDYAAGVRLGNAIGDRHFARSPEGSELTADLIKMLGEALPGELLDNVPVAMMRFLLGDRRADLLDVPHAEAEQHLIRAARSLVAALDLAGDDSPPLQRLAERFGYSMLSFLLEWERGPRRPPFRLPRALKERMDEFQRPSKPLAWLSVWLDALPLPRFVTRRFATAAPYPWLGFATRFKDVDGVIGAHFFEELATQMHARFEGRGVRAGLMEHFEDLRSDRFEPNDVAPVIRDFYEHTTDYDLGLEVKWNGPVWEWIGDRYREWVAGQIETFNFPDGAVKELDSWLELIDLDRDGRPDIRAWVRVHGSQRNAMWVGAYQIYRTNADGRDAAYISVSFPVPYGNLTTVLAPSNLEGGGMQLSTRDARSRDAGLYQILPRENTFTMFPAYGLNETFVLRPSKGGSEIQVHHRSTWTLFTMFEMHYTIKKKRPRDPERGREFVTALRDRARRAKQRREP